MRLTQNEIENIKTQARKHFGKNVTVFLFGSRTDDAQKGGDIDLYIQNQKKDIAPAIAKINFITDLIIQLGDQKIDVILESPQLKESNFYQSILQKAILL
jgi:predicted nucleotidyltransferase